MAELEGRPTLAAVVLGLLAAASGCAANRDKAKALPPVSETAEMPPESPTAESPVATPRPPTMVVIDEGGSEPTEPPKTLAEAARAEQARRARSEKPVVVLDNQNLVAHGKDQKLTIGGGEPDAATSPPPAGAAEAATGTATPADETYWRERALDIRQRWRAAADRTRELQGEAEALRRRFYAADDPYIRDGQIKPEWDRVLDELDQSRRDAERGEAEIERFLVEGREAGALPGWLREGLELEPENRPLKAPTAEPGEPVEAGVPAEDPS